jgi:hypothetical protein
MPGNEFAVIQNLGGLNIEQIVFPEKKLTFPDCKGGFRDAKVNDFISGTESIRFIGGYRECSDYIANPPAATRETALFKKVKDLLTGHKLFLFDEKQLQYQIMGLLSVPGFPFMVKEYCIAGAGRVDFFTEGGAIEVKVKGSPMAIYRQICKYAKQDEVTEVILLTTKTMSLPEQIEGKPANFINLSKAWL